MNTEISIIFEILMQMALKITVIWGVVPYNLVGRYQHFRRT
jgi:hypothetical protein